MQIKSKKSLNQISRHVSLEYSRYGLIKLDKNERLKAFDKKFIHSIKAKISSEMITTYPDQNSMLGKLEKFLNIPRANILLSPGGDAAIKYVFESFLEPTDEVVMLDPTYAMAEIHAQTQSAVIKKLSLDVGQKPKVNDILNLITTKTKIVYLANPNQPTGGCVKPDELDKIAGSILKSGALLVVDEAYHEFASVGSAIGLVPRQPNIVVVRTFSKAFGLAGLRLGYMVAQECVIDTVKKVQPLCDVNAFALLVGVELLRNYDVISGYVDEVQRTKLFLEKEFLKRNLRFINSETNFIHFDPGVELNKLTSDLFGRGILVRTQNNGLPATIPGMVRVTVGDKENMTRFLSELDKATHAINHSNC